MKYLALFENDIRLVQKTHQAKVLARSKNE